MSHYFFVNTVSLNLSPCIDNHIGEPTPHLDFMYNFMYNIKAE